MTTGQWCKSSWCESSHCVEIMRVGSGPRKSSWCESAQCVEVGRPCPDAVSMRDAKNPNGPVLTFTASAWQKFVERCHGSEAVSV
jgi:hypothetical protein